MDVKLFSQRFNKELVLLGLPSELTEKVKAISKVFKINNHMANNLIFGHALPSGELLDRIASILEVCPNWLSGNMDRKKA